jgi:homoserine dehydrogenase
MVLKAKELGYTESDVQEDLAGMDSALKVRAEY